MAPAALPRWAAPFDTGCKYGIQPLGDESLERARLEAGDLAPEVRESQPEDPRANLAWGRRWS